MNIRVFAEHVTPMLLVTLLRLGNLQKDLAVGTLGAASQVTVDACLRLFISQIAAPTLNLRGGGGSNRTVAGRLVLGCLSYGPFSLGRVSLKLLGLLTVRVFAVLVRGVRAHISLSAGCGSLRVSPGCSTMRSSLCVLC